MGLEETDFGAGAGGGNRGRDSGRAGTADNHITVGGERNVSLGFGEQARLRSRSSVEFAQGAQGTESEKRGREKATTGGRGGIHGGRLGVCRERSNRMVRIEVGTKKPLG